jgi:hypothetical protein
VRTPPALKATGRTMIRSSVASGISALTKCSIWNSCAVPTVVAVIDPVASVVKSTVSRPDNARLSTWNFAVIVPPLV